MLSVNTTTSENCFESPRLGRVIVDVKTGKRAYSEVALQLAAYRYCDDYLEEVEQRGPRGGRGPLIVTRPVPPPRRAACRPGCI